MKAGFKKFKKFKRLNRFKDGMYLIGLELFEPFKPLELNYVNCGANTFLGNEFSSKN
jgi:hypothetical protein